MGKLWQKVLGKARTVGSKQAQGQIKFHTAEHYSSAPSSRQVSREFAVLHSQGSGTSGIDSPAGRHVEDSAGMDNLAAELEGVDRGEWAGSLQRTQSSGATLSLSRSSSLGEELFGHNGAITSPSDIPDVESVFHAFLDSNPRHEALVVPFDELREMEYHKLDEQGKVCLDYIGAGLFSHTQLDDAEHPVPRLPSFIRGRNRSAMDAVLSRVLQPGTLEYELRDRVLEHFQTYEDEYGVIFTATAGAALQLLGDSYPFSPQTSFITAYDQADDSLDRMRKAAGRAGSSVVAAPISWPDLRINSLELKRLLSVDHPHNSHQDPHLMTLSSSSSHGAEGSRGLFALPAESRVSGTKHSLQWVVEAQRQGWQVLLDASGLSPGNAVNLQKYKPDFVVYSFYKVFGHDPTGFGCLLVRRPSGPSSSLMRLNSASTPASDLPSPRPPHPLPLRSIGTTPRDSPSPCQTDTRIGMPLNLSLTAYPVGDPLPLPRRPIQRHQSQQILSSSFLEDHPFADYLEEGARRRRGLSMESFEMGPSSSVSSPGASTTTSHELYRPSKSYDLRSSLPEGSPTTEETSSAGSLSGSPIGTMGQVGTSKRSQFDGSPTTHLVPSEGGDDRDWQEGSYFSTVSSFSSAGQRTVAEGELEWRGLDHLNQMGAAAVSKHLESLMEWLLEAFKRLKHPGMEKRSLVEVYGPASVVERGATVAFNIVDWKWDHVPPKLVQVLADRQNISLTVGRLWRHESARIQSAPGGSRRSTLLKASGGASVKETRTTVDCISASMALVSNFEDVYRLWVFVAQFLNPDFIYKESVEFQMMNRQTVKLS